MIDTQMCPECETAFDWPGIEVDEKIYCCEPCARGEVCVCPQHEHDRLDTDVAQPDVPLPSDIRIPEPSVTESRDAEQELIRP